MFTRQPTATGKTVADIRTLDKSLNGVRDVPPAIEPAVAPAASPLRQPAGAPTSQTGSGGKSNGSHSIIGNDLTIVGQGLRIITRGTLQVDGLVEGDVVGNEVIIGEKGRVTGVVCGQRVEVRGAVSGTVKGLSVSLKSGAHVEGDVHHQSLTVEQGAHLDGRVRRPANPDELMPIME